MTKIKCIACDKEITVQNMPRHKKTRLHKLNIKIYEKEKK